jgi:hypothetical protein
MPRRYPPEIRRQVVELARSGIELGHFTDPEGHLIGPTKSPS